MTAPTQVFPPWLTPVPVTTEVDGVQATATSVEFVPLTYFGPSIPLGTVFVFGGSTFPPTVVFGPQSTTSITSPSTSSPTSTSTSSTSSTTSPSTSTTSTQTSSVAATPTHSSAASVNPSHGLSLGTKLAIALSIGLVVILLLVLALVLLRIRRRRRSRSNNRFSDSDWQIVGSPESADREGAAEVLLPEERVMRQRASLSSTPVLTPWMRTAYEPVATAAVESHPRTSQNSTRSTAGGIGSSISQANGSRSTIAPSSLFFNPAKSKGDTARKSEEETGDESLLAAGSSPSNGSKDYARLPAGASPPLFPPRSYAQLQSSSGGDDQFIPSGVIFDSTPRSKSRHHSTESLPYPESPPSETDERATLLTAQRVDLGPQVSVSSVNHPQRNRSTSPDQSEHPAVGASLAGLSRLAGLHRFSWFRRMSNQPAGYRHSSPPLSPTDELQRTTSFNRLSFHPASRPHTDLFYPEHDHESSDISYLGLANNELGLMPPIMHPSTRRSGGSGSGNGSGSGRSGPSIYHSATSRPGSFYPQSAADARLSARPELEDIRDTLPGVDAVTVGDTIRTVDVLDMPVPSPTLPLQAALSPDNIVSRGSSSRGSPRFPPGLVTVPRWDSISPASHEVDVLDQAPPRSPGEWSSMKSQRSTGGSPVERATEIEHNVEVTSARGPTSEEGIVEPGPLLYSPDALGFSLTPRVSVYAPSDHISHHSGSHSSRPSEHTTFSHETHASYNEPLSEEDYRPPTIQRASLSAIGGHDSGGRIQHLRRKPSALAGHILPAPEERSSEEEKSGAGSRPISIASGASRPTVSETVVSRGTTSNPAGQPFDSVGKASGSGVASIIDLLQSTEHQSPEER